MLPRGGKLLFHLVWVLLPTYSTQEYHHFKIMQARTFHIPIHQTGRSSSHKTAETFGRGGVIPPSTSMDKVLHVWPEGESWSKAPFSCDNRRNWEGAADKDGGCPDVNGPLEFKEQSCLCSNSMNVQWRVCSSVLWILEETKFVSSVLRKFLIRDRRQQLLHCSKFFKKRLSNIPDCLSSQNEKRWSSEASLSCAC